MTPDIAKAAIQFLGRAELKGTEAEAMVFVLQALQQIAQPPEPVKEPEAEKE